MMRGHLKDSIKEYNEHLNTLNNKLIITHHRNRNYDVMYKVKRDVINFQLTYCYYTVFTV